MHRPMTQRKAPKGFTIVELLVVIAIITVLMAILAPAMDRAMEMANRAVCASNQDAIGLATTLYTQANKGAYYICTFRSNPHLFSPKEDQDSTSNLPGDNQVDWLGAMAGVGLFTGKQQQYTNAGVQGPIDHGPSKVWTCPSMPTKAGLNFAKDPVTGTPGAENQVTGNPTTTYFVNYQYMGGIVNWLTPKGKLPSRSPIRLSKSGGGWVLTAEFTFRANGTWKDPIALGAPAHREEPNPWPAGGNQLTVDGAVNWVAFDDMFMIHTWNVTTRQLFFKQSDLGDYVPPVGVYGSDFKY